MELRKNKKIFIRKNKKNQNVSAKYTRKYTRLSPYRSACVCGSTADIIPYKYIPIVLIVEVSKKHACDCRI